MRYYVTSDIHGFYEELITSLLDKGYFNDQEEKKLIICGDIFDRGEKERELQAFILDLIKKNEIILIRGNHEDLALECIKEIDDLGLKNLSHHHISNGTLKTLLNLSELDQSEANGIKNHDLAKFLKNSDYIKEIIPATKNYFETDNYIFVHGWIPFYDFFGSSYNPSSYSEYYKNWREANTEYWNRARWANGMYLWNLGIKEPNKTIVCGHWNTSWGHQKLHRDCETQFDFDAIYDPFYDNGIIALDACTAHSRQVNVILLED